VHLRGRVGHPGGFVAYARARWRLALPTGACAIPSSIQEGGACMRDPRSRQQGVSMSKGELKAHCMHWWNQHRKAGGSRQPGHACGAAGGGLAGQQRYRKPQKKVPV
jgi:hypothetical protein